MLICLVNTNGYWSNDNGYKELALSLFTALGAEKSHGKNRTFPRGSRNILYLCFTFVLPLFFGRFVRFCAVPKLLKPG